MVSNIVCNKEYLIQHKYYAENQLIAKAYLSKLKTIP